MVKLTRRDFIKKSSVAASALGMGSAAELWATSGDTTPAKATFYVATNGNDTWSGKLADRNSAGTDGPFATLYRARDAVRELKGKQAPAHAVTVMVRGGKYYLDRTLLFGEEDSGSQAFPVSYKAYAGEKVILSGGKKVTGWKPYKGAILQTALPGSKGGEWKFRQLFLNGEPQIRSRYPKYDAKNPLYGGWLFSEGPAETGNLKSFVYKPGSFPRQWAKPGNGEVVMFPGGGWVNSIVQIKSTDQSARTITAVLGYRDTNIPPWYAPFEFKPGDRFRVENLLEEVSEPGEWCLDLEEGILYFWPPNRVLKPTDEVVAPALDTMVDIDGASSLVISGFTFTETGGGDDLHRFGLDGYGAMYPEQGWKYCGDALHLKDAENCVIEENLFSAVGGNAIYLERYNARNIIRRNEISYAGANGVSLLGNHIPIDSVSQPMRLERQPFPMFNEVTDNYIHHCGAQNKYTAGVFLGVSDSNLIAHNRLENLPHHAINLGLNGYGCNVLEYNDMRDVCQELYDNGAINCWMDDPQSKERAGHIIRFNRMTDMIGCHTDSDGQIIAPDGMANGIYLDNLGSNCLIQGNIIVRSSRHGIYIHGGQHNLVENNIIVDATTIASARSAYHGCGLIGMSAYYRGFEKATGPWKQDLYFFGNSFSNNIFYYTKGQDNAPVALFCFRTSADANQTKDDMTKVISQSRENVFFRRDGGDYFVSESIPGTRMKVETMLSLSEWQKLGFDLDSVQSDPLFVDPAHDDYRLKPESPAIHMGFVPIDVARIGIRPRS
jgi:parallel beta-helix repeat protein